MEDQIKVGLYMVLVAIFLSLQFFDITSTYVAISVGGTEVNELVKDIGNPFILMLIKFFVGFGFALVTAWLIDTSRVQEGFMLAIGYIMIYSYIIVNNLFMIAIAVGG